MVKLNKKELKFIMEGEPHYHEGMNQWYGVRRFFDWLNGNLYKMHVRVFLSKFRSYTTCPDCNGARLQPDSLNWKWQGHTLPELYQKSVKELLVRIGRDTVPQTSAPMETTTAPWPAF